MKDFNQIYQKIYKENYEELEILRKKQIKKIIIYIIIFVLIFILVLRIPELAGLLFIAILIMIVNNFKTRNSYNYKSVYKQKVIKTFIKEYDENLNYYPDRGIGLIDFRQAEFEKFDSFHSEDYIEGMIDDIKIKMAEVHTQRKSENKDGNTTYTTLFHGLFGIIELNQFINGIMKVRSDKGVLGKIFKGNTKVEMDSSEFEKYFDIYSDDKIQAMQILTSDVMEEMIDFYQKNKIMYEITLKENKLYIRFKCGAVFEEHIIKSSLDMDTLKRNYDIINFVFNVSKSITKNINQKEL